MGKPLYLFGRFSLDPLARELRRDGELLPLPASAFDCLVYLVEHRERPVGKDELIAAVWGRAEVSDNLLAQHVVRLRRTLDEEESCIRTVPRVGYRWVAPTEIREEASPTAPATELQGGDTPVVKAVQSTRLKLFARAMALAIALLLAMLASSWWLLARKTSEPVGKLAPGALTVVLPATVQATPEWDWLRYGLMDIVTNHLKVAGVRTVPSETVVAMSREGHLNGGVNAPPPLGAAWSIQPSVALVDGTWHVRFALRAHDGRSEALEVTSKDVLAAAKQASDALLAKLGVAPSANSRTPSDLDDWLDKIAAHRLANQIDAAQKVLDEVPARLRSDPRYAYARAMLECDRGMRDACQRHLQAMLAMLPASKEPVMRGRVLYTLGMRQAAAGQFDNAVAMVDEAIGLFEKNHGTDYLANAYLNRAWLAQSQNQLDVAVMYLGKGRATCLLSGDIFGMVRADFDMGLIAARRGQLDSAMAFLRKAYDQYRRYGASTMLPSVLDGMAGVAKLQLRYRDELAITDRFWPLGSGLSDVHMRRELTFVRAIALADNGRTMEATALARQLKVVLDPHEDSALVAEVPALLAHMAQQARDYPAAEHLAREALAGDLDDEDRSGTWLVLVRSLRQEGRKDEATQEAAAFEAWAAKPPGGKGWFTLYAGLATAETTADRDPAQGLRLLAQLMPQAQQAGVPEIIVEVGCSYADALLKAGRVDQAMAVSGALSAWAQDDLRVITLEARVYHALGQTQAWQQALQQARLLAGERALPLD